MKLRKSLLAFALAGLASGAAQALPYVGNFNTSNGSNVNDGVLFNVNGFDILSQGSAAFFQNGVQINPASTALLDPTALVTVVYQGVVNVINPGLITPNLLYPGQAGTYQLTVAATYQESVFFQTPGLAVLNPVSGGRVSIFYDDASLSGTFITNNADILAGIGYTDGKLIADGIVIGFPSSLSTTYTSNGTASGGSANLVGPLVADKGVDDPANLADVVGFLPTTPEGYDTTTTLQFGPDQGTDFQTINFFDNENGWSKVASTAALTERADANVNLTKVPEPASLALLGLGLAGLGWNRRRK